VLQRVNPIFAPSVLEDIAFMTAQMKERGFVTTELIPTKMGELGIIEGSGVWRMLTHIPGRTVEEGITEEEARSAMELIGKFHQTFADHDYDFRHVREGFHDTPRIMTTLTETMREYSETPKHTALTTLGTEMTNAYRERPHAWAHVPKRIIHGDPKLNNVRFAANSPRAIALLDLDTMGRHSVVVDIADAARSWCNRADEGDIERAAFDVDIFRAMMEGYGASAKFLTREERDAIPHAIAQIALELAARFATDAYRESYFTLDRERYPDLFTQNSAKARAQFALYRDILRKFPEITALAQP
jgi:Ser/Thr protein kinase RdoA (MazF antagonist)